jgi:hypothetical protein
MKNHIWLPILWLILILTTMGKFYFSTKDFQMTASKFVLPFILFVLTVAAGFWVSKTGKPYNTGIFTLHKLLALAAVAFAAIMITGLLKGSPAHSLILILVILAAFSVVALFATGALMSIQKNIGSAWLLIHRVAPFVFAGSTVSVFLALTRVG